MTVSALPTAIKMPMIVRGRSRARLGVEGVDGAFMGVRTCYGAVAQCECLATSDALAALAIDSEGFFKSVPVLRATLEKRIPIDKFIICLDLNQIAFMFQVCRFTIRNAQ